MTTSGVLSVGLRLSVTTDAAGAGFTGRFILGDPPASAAALMQSAATPSVLLAPSHTG